MRKLVSAAALVIAAAPALNCMVSPHEHEALVARASQMEKDVAASRAEAVAMRADLEATRQRLDNALRSNADSSSDVLTSKQRMSDLAGRVDELNHGIDELRREVGASRTALFARIDELKRVQQQPPPPAPVPVTPPADKAVHYKQLEDAFGKRDWPMVRALGPEYVNRYPTDDKADDALFSMGSADLQDGRPSSALGSFNRLLRLFPRSNVLDRTLFAMGDAYLMIHDCANAKVAYDACEKRFARDKIGADARAKLDQIGRSPPGLCAPN